MLFWGGRQLAQAGKGLESQLVIGARAPIVRLGSIRAFRRGEKPVKLPFAKLAFEYLRMAVRTSKAPLLLLLQARPLWMSGPAIDLRHLCVQSAHCRQLFQGATVEIKGAGKLLLAEARLRHQRQPVCRLWREFLQIVECADGERFVAAPQSVPGQRASGINLSELPVLLGCLCSAIERQQSACEHLSRVTVIRLQT